VTSIPGDANSMMFSPICVGQRKSRPDGDLADASERLRCLWTIGEPSCAGWSLRWNRSRDDFVSDSFAGRCQDDRSGPIAQAPFRMCSNFTVSCSNIL
jgi:hypothetical protein